MQTQGGLSSFLGCDVTQRVRRKEMSKKRFSSEKWKRYLRGRQLAELRKLRVLPARKRRGRRRRGIARPKRYHDLAVPPVFSVVQNPEETLQFIQKLVTFARRHNVRLDLSSASTITTDAVAALLRTMTMVEGLAEITGNQPSSQPAKDVLLQSGFFDHVRSTTAVPKATQGKVLQKRSDKVESPTAAELIHVGTHALHGSPQLRMSSFRALIEGMLNTHNHAAASRRNKETWWASVYADKGRGRICFTFVDTGVGIFKSVRVRGVRGFYRKVGILDNSQILRDILQGRVQSSTGLHYRGKGLPAIYNDAQNGNLLGLIIVTNDVYADVSAGQYRLLKTPFRGTLLYWETP
jgi:hypothetical protein